MYQQIRSKVSFGLLAAALLAAPCVAQAYTYKLIHVFTNSGGDGATPMGTPLLGQDGNIYGTTEFGGAYGFGTVYRVTPNGDVSYFYNFRGGDYGDGCAPKGGLMQDGQGNFYGTTLLCGSEGNVYGAGTVFKIAPDATETVLHSFYYYEWDNKDGGGPYGPPILDSRGNLFGTTANGGHHVCRIVGIYCGTIYRIDRAGQLHLIHQFNGRQGLAFPMAGLIFGEDGYMYGTTPFYSGRYYGTVYKTDMKGHVTIVYGFHNPKTGANPEGGLVEDSLGNFYGDTNTGGTDDMGVIYKVSEDGTETVLHNLTWDEGAHPRWGTLAMDAQGNLYGTTYDGGPSLGGVVFKLAPDGTYTILHAFDCDTGPCSPVGGVALDASGNIFGTTFLGDVENQYGVIFELAK